MIICIILPLHGFRCLSKIVYPKVHALVCQQATGGKLAAALLSFIEPPGTFQALRSFQ